MQWRPSIIYHYRMVTFLKRDWFAVIAKNLAGDWNWFWPQCSFLPLPMTLWSWRKGKFPLKVFRWIADTQSTDSNSLIYCKNSCKESSSPLKWRKRHLAFLMNILYNFWQSSNIHVALRNVYMIDCFQVDTRIKDWVRFVLTQSLFPIGDNPWSLILKMKPLV